MTNQVYQLFTGYSHSDPIEPNMMRANCSCTLIRTHNNYNIIVDTLTAWDTDVITLLLAEHFLEPKDIHYVICTHGHSDHTGCNSLFTNARWHIVGTCISNSDKYLNHNWGNDRSEYLENAFKLLEGDGDDVLVMRTPGHTLSCVSVIVRNTGLGKTVGIVGDLFERDDDILNANIWLEAGSEDERSQRLERLRIAEMCDYIIPGHGSGFEVTEQMRIALRQQV